MTLEEAIKHCKAVAKDQEKLCKRYDDASGYTRSHNKDIRTTDAKRCEECAEEHRQLAEWLKELKDLRSLVAYAEDFNLKIPKARLYKKASDEFIERMTKEQ